MQLQKVSNLNQPELDQVTALHYSVLKESFLNNFGKKFLNIAYKTLIKSSNNICLIIKDKKKIVGFLLATLDGDKLSEEVAQYNLLPLSWEVFKTSFRKPELVLKILAWELKKQSTKKIKSEIQFIFIEPKYQGKGLGTKLIKNLNSEFKKIGIPKYQVGTKTDNKLSNSFYQKLGFKLFYTDNFFGDDFNYYLSPKLY